LLRPMDPGPKGLQVRGEREEAMGPLEGKRALACGSTRGIGRACALEFARLGAAVTLMARNEQALRRTRDALAAEADRPGPRGGAGRRDFRRDGFSDPQSVKGAIAHHLDTTGPYTILLNNTGGPPGGPILSAEPFAFMEAFSAHLVCNQILAQALVPGMKEARHGRIINIVSTSVRQPIMGLGVSNPIRASVAGWAKTLAAELAPFGITVNNILPGATETERLRSLFQARAKAAQVSEADVEREFLREIPMGRFAR